MCSATLDITRRTWTREDWNDYNKKDNQFAENFKDAMVRGNKDEVYALIEEGKHYYHFPDISSMQILFSKNMDFYLSVMSMRNLFYQYETV